MQLTAAFVQQIKPPIPGADGKGRQVFFRDTELVGFGVRVASGGTKSYILERRIRGKVKRITLGRYDQIDFEKARSRARKLIGEIDKENAPRILNRNMINDNITLQDAFNVYLAARPNLSRSSIEDYQRSMCGPLQDWLDVPIKELTKETILIKHEVYRQRGQARCNNALRLLSAILNHARWNLITEDHRPVINNNPVDVLRQRAGWYPSARRKSHSFIEPEQLKKWWQATLQLRKESTRDYLQFLLLSGLPHAIASRLRFDDLDFANQRIVLKTDNGVQSPLLLPLTGCLNRLLQARVEKCSHAQHYIFPGQHEKKPLSDPRSAIRRVCELSAVHFSLNDLHRTFIHLAEKAGGKSPALTLITALFRHKPITMTNDDIKRLRKIQDQVNVAVFDLIGTST